MFGQFAGQKGAIRLTRLGSKVLFSPRRVDAAYEKLPFLGAGQASGRS